MSIIKIDILKKEKKMINIYTVSKTDEEGRRIISIDYFLEKEDAEQYLKEINQNGVLSKNKAWTKGEKIKQKEYIESALSKLTQEEKDALKNAWSYLNKN